MAHIYLVMRYFSRYFINTISRLFSTNLKFYRNFILLPDNCEEISKLKNMLESSRKRESMKETSQTPEFILMHIEVMKNVDVQLNKK